MRMDAVAHALTEPSRREILRLVRDDERTVGDIASHFPVTRPAISQHLPSHHLLLRHGLRLPDLAAEKWSS